MSKNKLALISVCILALPVLAFAQLTTSTSGSLTTVSGLSNLIADIEEAMGAIFGAIVVVCFLTAGILFLTAGGQPEKVGTARSAFLWGIAGVVVGIIAYSIVAIVSSVLVH